MEPHGITELLVHQTISMESLTDKVPLLEWGHQGPFSLLLIMEPHGIIELLEHQMVSMKFHTETIRS